MPGAEVVVFGAIVAVLAVMAVRVGMLVAPALDRLTQPTDEDARDDDD
jgi:hypothetical protein